MRPALWRVLLVGSTAFAPLSAQRVYERGNEVVYEASDGQAKALGAGFDAKLLPDGKVLKSVPPDLAPIAVRSA